MAEETKIQKVKTNCTSRDVGILRAAAILVIISVTESCKCAELS